MYIVSDSFIQAMKHKPYVARLTLEDKSTIQGDAIQEIIFRGGTNGETEAFTLGGAVSGSVEITLNKALAPVIEQGQKISIELEMELEGGSELLPMGVYYVTDPTADDDVLTVKASDALAAKLDRAYEPLDGFDFDSEGGVDSKAFLLALCERRGVAIDAFDLEPIALHTAPDGFTERQIVGFIAALYGGFAHVDRAGVLRISTFSKTDQKVTADDYYDGGMMKAEYTFTVQWIKCFNEITELTMIMGDTAAKQGIYLESIWMNNVILSNLWEKLQGFSYAPVEELSFFGNPLLDAGDIITMEDMSGTSYEVPVMGITHEYDGGIITRVTANGQAETEERPGSVSRQIKRVEIKAKTYSGISLEEAKKYTDNLDKTLDQLEMLKRLTAESEDAIYEDENGKRAYKATAILVGVIDAAIVTVKNLIANNIIAGRLQSKNKKVYFDLDSGEIVAIGDDGGIEVKDGTLTYAAPQSRGTVKFFAFGGDGGPALMLADANKILKLGLFLLNDEPWMLCKNVGSGNFSGGTIGRKTISFLDASGNVQTEDFYVSY